MHSSVSINNTNANIKQNIKKRNTQARAALKMPFFSLLGPSMKIYKYVARIVRSDAGRKRQLTKP